MTDFERLANALSSRYRIERELGRGGMAIVYLAEDLRHHRRVAIKVLKSELSEVLGAERFIREIEIVAGLTHPHILPLYDSGEAGGVLFYVMPFVDGESLRNRLDREHQLPLDESLRIAREVSDALSFAHQRGVVHRDIKPENILLQAGHAIVADFGIAKAISAAGGTQLTQTGLAIGTAAYMSPEAATGEEVDGRSDLYAIGCVLFEMLAGRPPFVGPTSESLVRQHVALEPPNVSTLRPAVPASVAAAVSRALAKTPADRFNPVAQFAEALADPAYAPLGTSAAPQRRQRLSARHIVMMASAIAVAVAVWAVTRPPRSRNSSGLTSLLVLPLENLSRDAEQQVFVDGIHDALIGELGQIAALRPISRTTAMNYGRASGKTLRQIRDELNVGSVIEGSVVRVGDSLTIEVRLVETETERPLWRQRYQRDARSAMTVLREVTSAIAGEIGAQLTASETGRLAEAVTISPEAQDFYLRGRIAQYRRDRDGFRISVDAFTRALQAEPRFAPAYAALANSYALAISYGWLPIDSNYAAAARSLALGNRAIALDSTLAEGWAARGNLSMRTTGPPEFTEKSFRRAIALKPNLAEAHGWFAQVLAVRGVRDEAHDEIQAALSLDPQSPGLRLGRTYVMSLLHDDGMIDSATVLQSAAGWIIQPQVAEWYIRRSDWTGCMASALVPAIYRAVCLHRLGRAREAATEFERHTASTAPSNRSDFDRAMFLVVSGRTEEAIATARSQFEKAPYGGFGEITQPGFTEVWGSQLTRPDDPFGATWTTLRHEAWNRIVRESANIRIP